MFQHEQLYKRDPDANFFRSNQSELALSNPKLMMEVEELLGMRRGSLSALDSPPIKTVSLGKHQAELYLNNPIGILAMTHPGKFGPHMHTHAKETELFLIREGEYLFEVDGKRELLGPGSFIRVPPEVPHTFKCMAEEGKTFVFINPPGFENYFFAVAEGREKLDALSSRYGLKIVGRAIDNADFWNLE